MRPILDQIKITGNYKKWKIEKWFEAEVFKYLRTRDYFCYHIADVWLGNRLLDWIIISPTWEVFFIEFKKTDWYSFNMSQFEPSQIYLLELIEKRCVEAYIMIYSQKTNTYKVTTYTYLKEHQNEKWWIKLFNNDTRTI